MSIQNDSAGGLAPGESRKARKGRLRLRYESCDLSLRELARLEGVPESTVLKWSMQDKWKKRKHLVREVVLKAESDFAQQARQIVKDELAPFIEREKVKITRQGVKMGKHGLKRLESLWKLQAPTESKSEAESARAVETLVRVVRTSLGMNDGTPGNGPINLPILINQSAVQIVTPNTESQ